MGAVLSHLHPCPLCAEPSSPVLCAEPSSPVSPPSHAHPFKLFGCRGRRPGGRESRAHRPVADGRAQTGSRPAPSAAPAP
eukprot:183620-Rhodomonas_salina.2